MRKWEMVPARGGRATVFKGTRAEAVAEANRLTGETGSKVHTQPKGTTFRSSRR